MLKQVIIPPPIQESVGTTTWKIWFNKIRDLLAKSTYSTVVTNGSGAASLAANAPAEVITLTNTGWLEITVNGEVMYIPYWQ